MTTPGDLPFLDDLDGPALAAAGIEGWAFGYRDRVRFGELDALNHVNNVAYLRWFETVRVRYLQGTGYYDAGGGAQSVVRRVTADYRAPITGMPPILLTGRTASVKESSFVMEYAVFTDRLCATGEAVVVSLGPDGRTRTPLPDAIRRRMIEVDGATDGLA